MFRLRVNSGALTQSGESFTTAAAAGGDRAFQIGGGDGQTGTYTADTAAAVNGGRVRIGELGGTGVMSVSGSTYTDTTGQDTWAGDGVGSVGTLNLTDSTWTIINDALVVGRAGGTGNMNLAGASVMDITGQNIYFGDQVGTVSTSTVTGTSSLIARTGEIWVGQGGHTAS